MYKKIWLPEGGDNEAAMHIVYRMRGLLGDATEEFIETLDAKSDQEVNNEEVYKMANVMAECRGLEVILNRLSTIEDLSRSRPLLQVLLKLLGLCVKVKHNQEVLTDPKLGSIPILLNTLELCLSNEADGLSNTVLTEQTLDVSINQLFIVIYLFIHKNRIVIKYRLMLINNLIRYLNILKSTIIQQQLSQQTLV